MTRLRAISVWEPPIVRLSWGMSLLFASFCLPGSETANTQAPTEILPAKVTPAIAPPNSYFKIEYNWQAHGPLKQSDSVFVHFMDSTGRMVQQGDHSPPVPTDSPSWQGPVSYPRHVSFKVPGTYKIIAGLYNKNGREKLAATKSVIARDDSSYEIGSITIDSNAPAAKADTEGPKTLNLRGYHLTFNEEFDSPLDISPHGPGTRWTAHTPWNGDFGDAWFTDPKPGFPFTVSNGLLRIEASNDGQGHWRAGLLASNDPKGDGFSQQYGYFEMRAKLPSGPGVWPAFWLSSSPPGADSNIEIDVLEFYGDPLGSYMSTVHVWKPAPHRGTDFQVVTRPGEVSDDFHRYGALVDPEWITMYFDEVEVWKARTPPEHKRPLMILLNLALGGGWPIDKTPNPSYMYVDYVRAYAK
jgi:hypothetical protein